MDRTYADTIPSAPHTRALPSSSTATTCRDRQPPRHDGAFVERHHRLFRVLISAALRTRGQTPTRELVDDLAQDMCCRLLVEPRCTSDFGGDRSPYARAFLSTCAHNLVVDHLRRTGRRNRHVPLVDPGGFDMFPASEANPEQRLLARERRRVVLKRCRAVAGANHTRRSALVMVLRDGYTSREAAARLPNTNAGQIDRWVSRLRERLDREGIALPRRRGSRSRACYSPPI